MPLLGLLNFTHFVSTAGYGAIFLLCVLQSCCIPTSSELTMGFAGVLAAQGKLSLAAVIVAGVAGEVVGAYIAWVVGRYAGRAAVDRFGRYILLTHHDLDRAEAWYDRHQRLGVFGSRLLPVIRNFVALPAGIAEVPLVRFGILTAAGSLVWVGGWAGIGYGVGGHWHAIAKAVGDLGYVLIALVVAALAFGIYHRYRSYKSDSSGDSRGPAAPAPGSDALGRRSSGDSQTGTVRWLSGSSGGPPVRSGPEVPSAQGDNWVGGSSARPSPPARRRDFPDSPLAAWEAAVLRGRREEPGRGRTGRARHRASPGEGNKQFADAAQLPLIGRLFPAPVAAKVPEVVFVFWIVKILTTAGGEATSDYLRVYGNLKGGVVEVGLFLLGLVVQFGTRRYRAFSYWFLAFAIAIFGTGVSDFLHLDVGIPYAGTTLLWAVVLGATFLVWQRSEGTLSIHSITTQRREAFYWATVFFTFALGTALGDLTATSLHLGYLGSGVLFGVVIFVPAIAWWRFGLNGIAAFWMSYIVTRPLGASFADYIGKPRTLSGINFGEGATTIVFALAVLVLVCYLAIVRPDIQEMRATAAPLAQRARHRRSRSVLGRTPDPAVDLE